MKNPCKSNSAAGKFWDLAYKKFNLTEEGYSDWITYKDWQEIGLSTSNGCQWLHKGNKLKNIYNFETIYGPVPVILENGEIVMRRKVQKIRFAGLTKISEDHSIPNWIREYWKGKPSALSGTYGDDIELDHKNALYNEPIIDPSQVQPLRKQENDFKREQCKKCRATNCRYDAKNFPGNSISYYYGEKELNIYGCPGCMLYDITKYREVTTRNAKPLEILE